MEAACTRTIGSLLGQVTGLGPQLAKVPAFRLLWKPPVVDVLGLVSNDGSGTGIQFGIGLDHNPTCTNRELRLLTRLATHLGAADRLRRVRRTDRLDDADAVLSPRGKLLHARCDDGCVRDGVARRDHARKTRRDPDKALEVWQGLAAGRWSIVDHLDSDGKRFVLAIKNAPEVEPRAELAPQDRRVAALAAMGHRDKEIAYMLGLPASAVTSSLRRARAALGVRSRAELAAAWRRGAR
ncbi:MAG TPA: helix-turn-helix transcriptional regulator [Kofleriaceae bacterium]|nr:helix-turn-helix transcriptional regulator [Kofleriaceae bacterium]